MTDVTTSRFGPKDRRDEKLAPILNHLYGHAVPGRALDSAILPGITDRRATRSARPSGVLRRFRGRHKALAASLVAAAIAALIAVNVLPNPASPQYASALTVLRRSAASLVPSPGVAVHRAYSIHVPCPGHVRCPKVLAEVWTANLKGTFVTYQVMRLTGVTGAAARPAATDTSVVYPLNHGGILTSGGELPGAWLASVRRQLGWKRNLEPAEYFQAWTTLAGLNDPQSMTVTWVKQLLRSARKSAHPARKIRRVNFDGAPSYQIRLPQQYPHATGASIGVLYIDAHTYAVRGVTGLTCPVFGKTYPLGCVTPRFVPKCFVDIGNSSTHVWVPRGCPTKITPFRAVLTTSRSEGVCRAPRFVFGWYFRSHGGYPSRCRGKARPADASTGSLGGITSGEDIAHGTGSGGSIAVAAGAAGSRAGVRALGASGWPQPRYDAARTAFNPSAKTLSPSNVSRLRLKWRRPDFSLFPVAANGLLYQPGQDSRSYVALRLRTRVAAWRFVPGGFVELFPTIGSRFVYAPVPAALYALDPRTGQPEWSFFPPRHEVVSGTPVASGSVVIISVCPPQGDGKAFIPHPCHLYVLNASTGRRLRVYGDPDGATPAISDGVLYLTSQGTVRAVKLATGRRLWTFPSRIGAHGQFHGAGSDVAVSNGIVYAAGDGSGAVYALSAKTGRELWWFSAGLREGELTDAALAYGHVFVGQIGIGPKAGMYCLNGRTGRVLWHFKDEYGFEAGPSVANGVVYAADTEGRIFALRASSGRRLWSATVNHNGRAGNLAVANGLLLVEYGGRGVLAYGLPGR